MLSDDLERYMRLAQDTKKEFSFNKSDGKWYWFNQSFQGGETGWQSEPFDSFWECLLDAVAPYLSEEE
jgi:hypothetical protein